MSGLLLPILQFLLILPAIVLHEVSHGFVAYRLGDPTAKQAGRLTLNPIKHIDLFGTLLLPAFLLLASGGKFSFGYAKPVPVNPHFFKNYRTGFFLTGIAGPTTNLLLATASGVLVRVLGADSFVGVVFYYFAYMNLVLMFFNLIPLPPLDGSRIIPLFLSDAGMRTYARVEQYGFGLLLLLLWGVPTLTRMMGIPFDPMDVYFSYTVDKLMPLLTGVG